MKNKNNYSLVVILGIIIFFLGVFLIPIITADPSFTIRNNSYIAHEITSECNNANIRYCKITYYEDGTHRSCIREGYFLNPNKKDVRIYFKGNNCGISRIGFEPLKIGVSLTVWLITSITIIFVFIKSIPLIKIINNNDKK